jgi:hypothetical protein
MYVCIPNVSLYICVKFVLCKCVVQAKNIEMKYRLVFLISGNKIRQFLVYFVLGVTEGLWLVTLNTACYLV